MSFSKIFRAFFVWAFAAGVLVGGVEAKVRIMGTIKDLDGNPIANATIEVTDTKAAKTKTETSGKDGKWAIITDGKVWKFVVKAEGFETYEEERPLESLGAKPTLNFKLAPASGAAPVAAAMPAAVEGPAAPQVDLADLKAGNDLFDQETTGRPSPPTSRRWRKTRRCSRSTSPSAMPRQSCKIGPRRRRSTGMVPAEDPKHESSLVGIAKVQVGAKNYDAALATYKKVLAVNAQNPDANYMSGTILFDIKGDAQAAQKYLEAAAVAKPDWAPVQAKLGYVYINVGDNPKAKAAFQKIWNLIHQLRMPRTLNRCSKI